MRAWSTAAWTIADWRAESSWLGVVELVEEPVDVEFVNRALQERPGGNPDWYHNLRPHPDVTIEVGTDTFKATAHEASAEERERLFAAMVERSPNFAEYQRKTERLIHAIVIEPVS